MGSRNSKVKQATKIRRQSDVITRMEEIIGGLKLALMQQKEKTEFWKRRWEQEKAKNTEQSDKETT